jgi:hypothetical protein
MIKQALRMIFNPEKAEYYNKLRRFFIRNLRADFARTFKEKKMIADFSLFEQRYYSQNGEDGILRVIFDIVKTTNRFCVEFGIHSNEGNTIYLKKQNWNCLWMDGNGDGSKVKKEFITAENINSLFAKYQVPTEFDLLSIDIDTNDYWVWKALKNYFPRVVVMEYNSSIPSNESKSTSYDPTAQWDGTNYFGASLLALRNLGDSKGYTLITCDSIGVNAFFVRNDLVEGNFRIEPIEKVFRPPGFGKKVNGKHIGHPPSSKSLSPV